MIKINESDNTIQRYMAYFLNHYVNSDKEFKAYVLTIIEWKHSFPEFCKLVKENYPQYLDTLDKIILLK